MIARKCTPQELFRHANTSTGGGLVRLIEIRRSSGVLLIGRKGAFPAIMLKANDEQRCASTLRTLAQDRAAIVQLRAQWSNIFAARLPENSGAQDPARLLLREIAAGSIQAILLRTPRIPLTPADVAQITTGAINVGNEQRRLLIANKGTLPPQVLAFNNSQAAIAVLKQLRDSDATARQIDLQAGRLNPGGKVMLSGASLRKYLAQQIGAGVLDAAVVDQPAAATAIAARPDAETPPGQMGSFERIGSALKRSLPYAIESGDEAIRLAVEEFLQPESIAVMIAMAAAVALANTNPVTGADVNTTLVLLGWANGGMKAINGISAFVMATIEAHAATTEAGLDKAAKAYGKALGAMGPDLLNTIVGKFVPKKGGGGTKGGKAGVSGAVPQVKNQKRPIADNKTTPPSPQRQPKLALGKPDLTTVLDKYQVEYGDRYTIPVDKKFEKFESMSVTEIRIAASLTLQGRASEFKSVRDEAFQRADDAYPQPSDWADGKVNWKNLGHNDAFRHTYWNARMTQVFGENTAQEFATAHENDKDNEDYREAQDLYNNELGRKIGRENPNATPEELAEKIKQAITNGDAIVVDRQKHIQWSNSVPVGEHYSKPARK